MPPPKRRAGRQLQVALRRMTPWPCWSFASWLPSRRLAHGNTRTPRTDSDTPVEAQRTALMLRQARLACAAVGFLNTLWSQTPPLLSDLLYSSFPGPCCAVPHLSSHTPSSKHKSSISTPSLDPSDKGRHDLFTFREKPLCCVRLCGAVWLCAGVLGEERGEEETEARSKGQSSRTGRYSILIIRTDGSDCAACGRLIS